MMLHYFWCVSGVLSIMNIAGIKGEITNTSAEVMAFSHEVYLIKHTLGGIIGPTKPGSLSSF